MLFWFLFNYRSTNSTLYRICRYALPFQAGLLVLLGIASMIPLCREEVICSVQNSFRDSLEPMLTWNNGSPPLWENFVYKIKFGSILCTYAFLKYVLVLDFSKNVFKNDSKSKFIIIVLSNNFAPPIEL